MTRLKAARRREILGCLLAGAGIALVRPSRPAPVQLTQLRVSSDGDLLAFKPRRLTCTAGARVRLTLVNRAKYLSVEHNWVLVAPGAAAAVAHEALSAGEKEGWVPRADPRVLAATQQCGKGQHVNVEFFAPAPGQYPFLCTNPGHAEVMHGVLIVIPEMT